MIARSPAAALKIGLDSAGLLMSPEEFDAIQEYDENYRYELIDGVLVVNPIPSLSEVGPNEMLGFHLRAYQRFHKQGKSLDDTYPERFIRLVTSRRRADRVIYTGLGRMPNEREDLPTIVVEFVSKSRRDWLRDYEHKRKEYAVVGIREYWIIDRFDRTLTAYRFAKPKSEIVSMTEHQVYSTPLLPGFKLKLDEILGYADRVTNANLPKPRKKKKP